MHQETRIPVQFKHPRSLRTKPFFITILTFFTIVTGLFPVYVAIFFWRRMRDVSKYSSENFRINIAINWLVLVYIAISFFSIFVVGIAEMYRLLPDANTYDYDYLNELFKTSYTATRYLFIVFSSWSICVLVLVFNYISFIDRMNEYLQREIKFVIPKHSNTLNLTLAISALVYTFVSIALLFIVNSTVLGILQMACGISLAVTLTNIQRYFVHLYPMLIHLYSEGIKKFLSEVA